MQDEMVAVKLPAPNAVEGTWDGSPARLQMRAIGLAMREYFEAEDWLAERDKQIPTMRRMGAEVVYGAAEGSVSLD